MRRPRFRSPARIAISTRRSRPMAPDSTSRRGARRVLRRWTQRTRPTRGSCNAMATAGRNRCALAEPVNGSEADFYPSVTKRGVLYFDSFRSRPRRRLVYRAEPRSDGTLAAPEALDATINADSGASNLFVDPDERYVVFGADRPEGRGGIDLYISWRTGATWTPPRNLGPMVNTAGTEFCPFVSRDGKVFVFSRAFRLRAARRSRAISMSCGLID